MEEADRLKLEPFKTMVTPSSSETLDELKGWREPKGPYILLESNVFELGERRWKKGLMTMNAEGKPEIGDRLRYYVINKGYRVIHYGKFLKANSPVPGVTRRINLYSGGSGQNPWDVLENEVKTYLGLSEKTNLESALQKKLEEANKKAAELEKKLAKGAGTNGDNHKGRENPEGITAETLTGNAGSVESDEREVRANSRRERRVSAG